MERKSRKSLESMAHRAIDGLVRSILDQLDTDPCEPDADDIVDAYRMVLTALAGATMDGARDYAARSPMRVGLTEVHGVLREAWQRLEDLGQDTDADTDEDADDDDEDALFDLDADTDED